MIIPEGYKMVPVEPTAEMLAVDTVPLLCLGNPNTPRVIQWRLALYTSMLAAAPSPPQPIYDEASERDRFDSEYEKICCRTGITIREIAWRMWQSRAKAGEAGHG